ncbi:3-(cis-5,6-dihydroxycyclohexa-1, 3-dien-1-yl)propanoate dehydrogenase [Steroidobacter agaridevorans]|uniref:3-(Cis-5,6-dihydroxycyclohexa-1, 3-dien-1-yl)propanoate dehydrogenase n=1 Tax=Steroidobacter agaridevorans TaxID=2695856 RepID=A0A829YMG8_9GAMM|nr:SDR family NAD(P)-dependent oxidoreductase [Steroidobacter agaridevorans]GFE84644.1 3-(cis-5,6-dihydroxycyclohexa-1, 3-dien-1-yl)propanoate dehydrogenase [Steroidobacter agaridevorans]
MAGWLSGYVAAVTGGASGIGRSIVERYLEEGASTVVVLDRDAERLAELQAACPDRLVTLQGDVREAASHEAMVAAALKHGGRLDVLVGNAGVFDFNRPLRSYTPNRLNATLEEIIAVNVRGYLLSAMASADALATSRGSMIFTCSIAGFHAGCAGTLYTISKHAVVGLVRQLALELAPQVRVNGVGPGGTLTDLRGTAALGHAERSIGIHLEETARTIAGSTPLGFAQEPRDHAGLYVLLASRENARAITGEVLMSDGGVGVRGV